MLLAEALIVALEGTSGTLYRPTRHMIDLVT
jgi:hypothetical protein